VGDHFRVYDSKQTGTGCAEARTSDRLDRESLADDRQLVPGQNDERVHFAGGYPCIGSTHAILVDLEFAIEIRHEKDAAAAFGELGKIAAHLDDRIEGGPEAVERESGARVRCAEFFVHQHPRDTAESGAARLLGQLESGEPDLCERTLGLGIDSTIGFRFAHSRDQYVLSESPCRLRDHEKILVRL
jgi:hypothetical protein